MKAVSQGRAQSNQTHLALGRTRDPLLGTVINGRFRVEESLARGGMGRVYLARQAHVGRLVALKVVSAENGDPESRSIRRFLVEASILATIQHPNVVTLFDYGKIEGAAIDSWFIAMEYLRGETLAARLRTRGALPSPEASTILKQLVSGLREAHARGVIHRDLKPSNIVLSTDDTGSEVAKIVDFGVGKFERAGENLTKNGVLVGTPKYMAPEQFEGRCSMASDIYALGLVTYEMFAGRLPFAGSSAAEFMIAKVQRPLRAMRDVAPLCAASDAAEALVRRMLARHPDARPSVDEIYDEVVRGRLAPRPQTQTRPTALPPPLPAAASRPPQKPAPLATARATPNVLRAKTLTTLGGTTGAERPARRRIAVVAASGAIGLAAIGAAITRTGSPAAIPVQVGVPPAPSVHRLRIESTPSDAKVIEDGEPIGATPLELATPSSAKPRSFGLRKAGYVDAFFTEPAASGDVARLVVMTPFSPPSAPPLPSPTPAASKPIAQRGALGLEIRKQR